MLNTRKYIIPQECRNEFAIYADKMMDICPLACWEAGLCYNKKNGEFIVDDVKSVVKSLGVYAQAALKKCKAALQKNESDADVVVLKEASESNKNLAAESLKAVSDTLDTLKQYVLMAQEKVRLLSDQDIIMTKLRGLGSITDSAITDISEAITQVTGEQTTEDIGTEIREDMSMDDKGIEMDMTTAIDNSDKLTKFTDAGQNVIINDDK